MRVSIVYITKKGEARNLIVKINREITMVEVEVD